MIHKIKVDSKMYAKIKSNRRIVEVRPAFDRRYMIGDTVHFCEVNEYGEPTGREVRKGVYFVLEEAEGLKEGYVVLALMMKKGRKYVRLTEKDI